jgi:hypothetical protein
MLEEEQALVITEHLGLQVVQEVAVMVDLELLLLQMLMALLVPLTQVQAAAVVLVAILQ